MTQSRLIKLNYPINPVIPAWSEPGPSSPLPLCFGAPCCCWRRNMGTSGGGRQALARHHGRTQRLKASLCPSCWAHCRPQQERPWQDDAGWQVQRGGLEARFLQEEEEEEASGEALRFKRRMSYGIILFRGSLFLFFPEVYFPFASYCPLVPV